MSRAQGKGDLVALYLCTYRNHGGHKALDPEEQQARFDRLWRAMAGTHPPSKHFRGWYAFPGERAGVAVIEAASLEEVGAMITPWGTIADWTVKEVVAVDHRETDARVASRAATLP